VGAITAADVRAGQAVTKPSALLHLTRYQTWSDQYGQTGWFDDPPTWQSVIRCVGVAGRL